MLPRIVTLVALIVACAFGIAALIVAYRLDSLNGIVAGWLQVKILAYALAAAGLACLFATLRWRASFLDVVFAVSAVGLGALGAILYFAPWSFAGNVGHDNVRVMIAVGLAVGALASATISYRAFAAR